MVANRPLRQVGPLGRGDGKSADASIDERRNLVRSRGEAFENPFDSGNDGTRLRPQSPHHQRELPALRLGDENREQLIGFPLLHFPPVSGRSGCEKRRDPRSHMPDMRGDPLGIE